MKRSHNIRRRLVLGSITMVLGGMLAACDDSSQVVTPEEVSRSTSGALTISDPTPPAADALGKHLSGNGRR